jgi:hypothetical protein
VSTIANAGGGLGFNLAPGAGLPAALSSALKTIRLRQFSCTAPVPQGKFDITNPELRYGPGSNSVRNMTFHPGGLAECSANPTFANYPTHINSLGYYYDNPADPSKIVLCPATCDLINRDTSGGLRPVLQCNPTTIKKVYQADCTKAGDGKKPQWGFLTYDTNTPDDPGTIGKTTSVTFSIRVAQTEAQLAMATPVTLVTTTPATQTCLPGKAPPCWVDIVQKLGGNINVAQTDFLELSMDLRPDGVQAPTVKNWQLTYSCVDAQ